MKDIPAVTVRKDDDTTEPGIVRSAPLWMFVSDATMETTPGRPLGYWTRVVCTLRADGFFSQTDAETGALGDLLNLRDRRRRDVRLVDDSVLGRRHCFSIRGPLTTTFYAADNRASRLVWCTLLKQAASEEMGHRTPGMLAPLNLCSPRLPSAKLASSEVPVINLDNGTSHVLPGPRDQSLKAAPTGQTDFLGIPMSIPLTQTASADGHLRGSSSLDTDKFRIEKQLTLRVNEARKLQLDGRRCWLTVQFGDDIQGRTSLAEPNDLTWRDAFTISDISPYDEEAQLVVYARSKNDKDTRIGIVRVPLDKLPRAQPFDNWYPIVRDPMDLMSTNLSNTYLGDVRLRLCYEELVVLPSVAYEELAKLIMDDEPLLAIAIANASRQLDWLAERMLLIYQANNRVLEWLQFLIAYEVAKTDDTNILFRGNSIATKAVDAYMKLVGWQYLDDTIGGALRYICANRVCCEMDTLRLNSEAEAAKNSEELMAHARMIWKAIEASKDACPMELRQLFAHIQQTVMKKHSSEHKNASEPLPNVYYTCVSGLLFLRLFCPAVLSPKLFDLVSEHPDPGTQRTLTLLAKTLQCLANLVEFGVKEPFMKPMNVFLQEHMPEFKRFVEELTAVKVPGKPTSPTLAPTVIQPVNGRQNRRRGFIYSKQRRPLSESSIGGVLAASLQQPVPASLNDLSSPPVLPYMIDVDRELAALADHVRRNKERLLIALGEMDAERARRAAHPTSPGQARVSSLIRTCDPKAVYRLIHICDQIHTRQENARRVCG